MSKTIPWRRSNPDVLLWKTSTRGRGPTAAAANRDDRQLDRATGTPDQRVLRICRAHGPDDRRAGVRPALSLRGAGQPAAGRSRRQADAGGHSNAASGFRTVAPAFAVSDLPSTPC